MSYMHVHGSSIQLRSMETELRTEEEEEEEAEEKESVP